MLASGTLVEGCGGLSVSSPRMPSICGATDEGTSGADALSYPVLPEDRRYFEIGVEKADWTWATVPETGSDKPGRRGCPHRQALLAQRGGDLRDRGRGRPETLRELRRRQEVAVVRRTGIGDRLHLGGQRGAGHGA